MLRCRSCHVELSIASRFCSACGSPVGSDDIATLTSDDVPTMSVPPPAAKASPPSSHPSSVPSEGRFLPGRLLADRYRIIALLGKGGMGEVYRADDLTLGQPVALKFLPEEASSDPGLIERFRNEVRMARRVSHPNVCRVYDVGEVEGHTFFTMEYVDGEDLASLLRRIGRLPHDKAVEIARQLCAGLAAAHAKNVLHRDLKPANIMLDGRGQVVITDFGLAGLNDQIQGPEVRSGTPAYMSPEQLSGKEVTAQSDLYALGLVLYEVFTGKRAFTPEALKELIRTGGSSTPSAPSSVVKDLDPAVERVILRCLEPEPRNRPASALSVAAALPGGDPLAAALAAGETPSPQMVAAAGETEGLSPRVAMLCFAGLLLALAFAVYLTIRTSGVEQLGLEQSPEVLTHKAHELVAQLGYPSRPTDSAIDLDYDNDFLQAIAKNNPHPAWPQILAGRPSALHFYYRQSPQYMVPADFRDLLLTPGVITFDDPPTTISEMINLQLDPQGRLLYFQAIPPQKDSISAAPAAPDWNPLFAAAGLDPTRFQPASPQWNSLANSDARAAWTGLWPGTTLPLRVEAAAYRGKPVFFSLIGDWTKPGRMQSNDQTTAQKIGQVVSVIMLMWMMVAAAWVARLNYRRGRVDREGALRLAWLIFSVEVLLWLCRSHLVADLQTFGLFVLAVSTALFLSGLTWLLYLALEPYVRRFWPQSIISWSRLLSGGMRDPVVGRDILFGVMLGTAWVLIFKFKTLLTMHMGSAPPLYDTSYLLGGRQALGAWLSQVPVSVLATLQFFFLLLGLKILLRKIWLAGAAFVALFATLKVLGSTYLAVQIPTEILIYAVAVLIVVRFGLVPLACAVFSVNLLANVPFTADSSAWYASSSILMLLSVVALAAFGAYTSLGGKPLFGPPDASS